MSRFQTWPRRRSGGRSPGRSRSAPHPAHPWAKAQPPRPRRPAPPRSTARHPATQQPAARAGPATAEQPCPPRRQQTAERPSANARARLGQWPPGPRGPSSLTGAVPLHLPTAAALPSAPGPPATTARHPRLRAASRPAPGPAAAPGGRGRRGRILPASCEKREVLPHEEAAWLARRYTQRCFLSS